MEDDRIGQADALGPLEAGLKRKAEGMLSASMTVRRTPDADEGLIVHEDDGTVEIDREYVADVPDGIYLDENGEPQIRRDFEGGDPLPRTLGD